MSDKWLDWAKRIQSITQAGLAFSKDPFDQERYEELQKISFEIMSEYTEVKMEKLYGLFQQEKGYQTPKMDVRGVIFEDDKILLVKEKIDNKWSLPGGFCDVGLSPAENVVKEIREEAGYECIPTKLLAVMDMNKHPHPPQAFHYYKIFIQCQVIGGRATLGLETKDIGFFSEHSLPSLSTGRNTESQIKMLFTYLRNPSLEPHFD